MLTGFSMAAMVAMTLAVPTAAPVGTYTVR